MAEQQVRFEDGAAYEKMMGIWSGIAGQVFIDWLAPPDGWRWIDVGCGNGAFTELLVERCAPASVDGLDPSEEQLTYARTRPAGRLAKFQRGDAMSLPFADNAFDAAVMALVIFFVPEPAKGVAELARVTRPGGTVATYAWDVLGGGFPMEPVRREMQAIGLKPLSPPQAWAARMDGLHDLWRGAGLEAVESREIVVERTFADFEEYWAVNTMSNSIAPALNALPPSEVGALKARVRSKLPPDSAGRITSSARANAIKGRVPG